MSKSNNSTQKQSIRTNSRFIRTLISRAETVSKVFFTNWIARSGIPDRIRTDEGRINKLHTSFYHPQSNGILERWHKTFKTSLKAYANIRWTESLPAMLLGLRKAISFNIAITPAELL